MLLTTFPTAPLMFLSREDAFILVWKEAESEIEQPNH